MIMTINTESPYIDIEIDDQGNIKTEAYNYPTQNKVCQGEIATQPFELALIQEKLIPEIKPEDRQYKTPDKPSLSLSQQVNQSQTLNQ